MNAKFPKSKTSCLWHLKEMRIAFRVSSRTRWGDGNSTCSKYIFVKIKSEHETKTNSIQQDRNDLPRSWDGLVYLFDERKTARIVAMLSILIAASLLIGAIVALNYVRQSGPRLGIVGGFTLAFAASIGLLTSARRAEVFAATAAYAAVLVVYVSGSLNG